MDLPYLNQVIAHHMADIADSLPSEYRLTLVARYTGDKYKDVDIVVTDDKDPKSVTAAIMHLHKE